MQSNERKGETNTCISSVGNNEYIKSITFKDNVKVIGRDIEIFVIEANA